MEDLNKIGKMVDMTATYNRDAQAFAEQSSQLMTWQFVGSRALDANISDLYTQKGIRVLDQGSASGRVVEHLIKNGITPENIDGVELSPEQVRIAQAKNLGARFFTGDLREYPLPENTYDLITRHMVDEHLDNNGLLRVSQNTIRALKPGGVLVVVFTHPDKITASSGVTEEGWFETTFPWRGADGEFQKGLNYFRPVDVYLKILKEAGFVIDQVGDWKISEEAETVDKDQYEKYKKYGNIRLSVRAHKPINV